jgi:hypothetical protein
MTIITSYEKNWKTRIKNFDHQEVATKFCKLPFQCQDFIFVKNNLRPKSDFSYELYFCFKSLVACLGFNFIFSMIVHVCITFPF